MKQNVVLGCLPAAHHVAIAAEDLREAAHYNVRMRHHVDIQEVANSFVYNNRKVEMIRQSTNPGQIWAFQKRVSWEFAEQGQVLFSSFATLFEIVQLLG